MLEKLLPVYEFFVQTYFPTSMECALLIVQKKRTFLHSACTTIHYHAWIAKNKSIEMGARYHFIIIKLIFIQRWKYSQWISEIIKLIVVRMSGFWPTFTNIKYWQYFCAGWKSIHFLPIYEKLVKRYKNLIVLIWYVTILLSTIPFSSSSLLLLPIKSLHMFLIFICLRCIVIFFLFCERHKLSFLRDFKKTRNE